MENLWILFIFAFGILKGAREGMKKAALKKSGSDEILFFYTLIGFIFTLPSIKSALQTEYIFVFYAFLKALAVGVAWICAFAALKRISVSLYGIMDLSRMIFSVLLGVFVLNETLTYKKVTGIALVLLGLFLLNLKRNAETRKITFFVLIMALMNSFFNAVSGTMDKVLMQYMKSEQLQFWFMLFLTLIYGLIILIKKEKISLKTLKTNYWIPIMSISLIIGDRLLFEANASAQSQVTVMTVIKQCSVVVTVLIGRLAFKEKNLAYKLMCTTVVLGGIFVAIL